MKPLPFSPSSIDTFVNCGKQYFHKYVAKDLPPEVRTKQQIYGEDVHKHFEDYVMASGDYALPESLLAHKPKLDQLLSKDGVFWCEERVAMGRDLMPTTWDDPLRLWRGVIDFRLVDRDERSATICDYKTGKEHDKWRQLALYAIHTFALFPNMEIVNAQFYWTQSRRTTKKVWGRAEIEQLWLMFAGDLKQYKEAFKNDTWQERPSGLCHGWCPVKTCQHWKQPRNHR